MLMPTVFHENLFDDFFDPFWNDAAMVYKKKQYYHNYKACKQGALYGFAVLAVILLIFIIALILVVL